VQRCACAECRRLDLLPDRLQGIPGTWQGRLFPIEEGGPRLIDRAELPDQPPERPGADEMGDFFA
jgi:hypothetical protein